MMSLYRDFRKDLQLIEKQLERSVRSSSPVIQDASMHLLKAGGKRIRPIFVILSAQFGTYEEENVARVAVALELIHMASLVHDDVIDDSDMRRGLKTVKARYDNRVAMYTGDFMFARALETMSAISNQQMHETLAQTMLDICKGEIIQMHDQRRVDQNLRDYLRRIKRKTALLLSTSCELGARVSGTSEENIRRLTRFGYFAGMAFQIVDDILDIVSTDAKLGKPAGSDLLNGHLTLPTLYLLQDEKFVGYMNAAFDETLTEEERKNMLQYIRQSGAIEYAQQMSDRYLQKAMDEIEPLEEGRAKDAFYQIAHFIGQRKY